MKGNERHRVDQLLDLLAAEVAERLRAGAGAPESASVERAAGGETETGEPGEAGTPASLLHLEAAPGGAELAPEAEGSRNGEAKSGVGAGRAVASEGESTDAEAEPRSEPEQEAVAEGWDELEAPPPPPGPSHTARLLGRLALGLALLVVLINIPINRHGTTLATAMPDARALVFRDGLVVKEEDDPEIYVYQDGEFRWLSSLDAFERRGYTWEDVHVVDDGFLDDYPIGAPIHVLLKCHESPHIYRVEAEEKRWIVDIAAFEAAGHVWEDVAFVSCSYLRGLPDGETIPPGHGPPPQP